MTNDDWEKVKHFEELYERPQRIKVHCVFCDAEVEVPLSKATDYLCDDCKEFFRREMSDPVHETAKQFRRAKDGEQE